MSYKTLFSLIHFIVFAAIIYSKAHIIQVKLKGQVEFGCRPSWVSQISTTVPLLMGVQGLIVPVGWDQVGGGNRGRGGGGA